MALTIRNSFIEAGFSNNRTAQRIKLISQRLLFLYLCFLSSSVFAEDETIAWAALRDGQAVAIMRHALAPGTGDPLNHTEGVCSTQRNLSAAGRRQAATIGDVFRDNGIAQASVYTSSWCRCVDTGVLLDLGKTIHLPALNSFFHERSKQEGQTNSLREWVKGVLADNSTQKTPSILVTHAVNIAALTRVFPVSGEVVIIAIEDNSLKVLWREKTDAL